MGKQEETPTLAGLQHQLNEQAHQLNSLRLIVNEYEILKLRANFSKPVLAESAQRLICQHFNLGRRELQGIGMSMIPGKKTMARQRAELQLDTARMWLICLVRVLDGASMSKFQESFPWTNHRHWRDAQELIEQISQNPAHADKPIWLDLLTKLREELIRTNQSTQAIDDEITYATNA